MWEPIPINGLLGRVKAVSVPGYDAEFHVWTDAGIFTAFLARKRKAFRVHPVKAALTFFDAEKGTFRWPITRPMHGECGPDDRLYTGDCRHEHPSGQRIEIDGKGRRVVIRTAAGELVQSIDGFPAGAARWAVAGFSDCGRYLVVASPGTVRAFRFAPHADRAIPATHAAGGAADRAALLRAVAAAPDDDTPRLVYADWLEEHGDPARGEFIRLQCRYADRLAAGPVPADEPDVVRARELWEAHGDRWRAELGTVRGLHWHAFRRGFPGVWAASATTLARMWKRVREKAPSELVYLLQLDVAGANRLAASDALSDIRDWEIGLTEPVGSADPYRPIFASPRVGGLRRLQPWTGAGDDVAELIAAFSYATGLEWLDLTRTNVTDRGARAILASKHLTNLRGVEWPQGAPFHFALKTRAAIKKRFPVVGL
jgi:uncharacterized protein (TIGR02996 family)